MSDDTQEPTTDVNPEDGFVQWKGRTLHTDGDTCQAMYDLADENEAARFMAAVLAAQPEHGASNIGYILGYMEPEVRTRLYVWLTVVHPAYGSAV